MTIRISFILVLYVFTHYYQCLYPYNLNENFINRKKLIIKEDTLEYKKYTLKIITSFLDDSVLNTEINLFSPICIKHDIYFIKDNKMINHFIYNAKNVKQRLVSGKKITMLDNVIVDIGVIKGEKDAVFTINGYGGCNSCSELYSIYTLDGKLLYCLYQKGKKEYNNFGDFEKIFTDYGINQKDYLSGNYRKKDVYYSLLSY